MIKREEGRCYCCGERTQVRYIDLYVIGSEGWQICHPCEMLLVEAAQNISRDIANKKKEAFLERHRQSEDMSQMVNEGLFGKKKL